MQKDEEKTGVIYCRVSSQEQVAGTSLAMQEKSCREYAEKENIEILACFVEEGESAKTADRTEFQKALNFCTNKRKPINFFIVHKIDRFARNQDDHAVTQTFLKRYGTKLRSVTEHIDETPVGRAMEGMLAVFAEFDNNVRSSRSKSGMEERIKEGTWVWRAPMGYKRLVKGGSLVIDDLTAPCIRLAFEEYSKGIHTYDSLSKYLFVRGFRGSNSKPLYPQFLEKMLKNPIYCGILRVWGNESKGKFEPIISEELFYKCQKGYRGHKKPTVVRSKDNPGFPLRRICFCSECKKSLTGSSPTSRGRGYSYYHHHKQGCPNAKFIPKEIFEQLFVQYLNEITPNRRYEKLFKAIVIDIWQSNYKKLDENNERIRTEIKQLEVERQRVFDLHRFGKYSDEEFQEQKNFVNQNIYQKQHLLQDNQIEEFNMEEALDHCFKFVRETAKTWIKLKNTNYEHLVRFQNQIFPEKITFNGEKFGTDKLSLVYNINKETAGKKSDLVTLQRIEL
ncbi:MAG: recombinase family protein [Minisyncoccia bacterium]